MPVDLRKRTADSLELATFLASTRICRISRLRLAVLTLWLMVVMFFCRKYRNPKGSHGTRPSFAHGNINVADCLEIVKIYTALTGRLLVKNSNSYKKTFALVDSDRGSLSRFFDAPFPSAVLFLLGKNAGKYFKQFFGLDSICPSFLVMMFALIN